MVDGSAIPTFHESDDEEGERDYIRELKTWLPSQPQDAWLMVVKNMNWDSMDSLLDFMVADPDCDIAIAAMIFWATDPGYHLANWKRSSAGAKRIARILANIERGSYGRSELALNRLELLDNVQGYAEPSGCSVACVRRRHSGSHGRCSGHSSAESLGSPEAATQPNGISTKLSTVLAARAFIVRRPNGATPTRAIFGFDTI